MKQPKISLHVKLLFGYIISVAIIGIMVAILLYEQSRIKEIAANSVEINDIRQNVTAAHREITELATLGESVIGWDEEDCRAYHAQRLRLDSLLLRHRRKGVRFVRPEQVDTLRILLATKETHLLRIMQSVRQRETVDSLIAQRLPTAVASAAKPRIEVRRKKGIAGFFGKKDTIRVYPPSQNLHALNSQITTLKDTPEFNFDAPVDSLRRQNRQLNRELSALISLLDGQAQMAFDFREKRIADMRQTSFRILSCVLGVAILLLALSYIIIQRDIRRREAGERKLKEIIGQNRDLLDMRKKIILTISHDIRAPLSIINGSAELAMETRDRKRRNSHLTNIGKLCKHILHLLNNLLDVYRLNEAKETREGFFDSVLFHRVIADFMIQAGDPASRRAPAGTMLGEADAGYLIPAEIVYPALAHTRGALAAARTSDEVNPERKSSGSQFYIVWGKPFDGATLDRIQQSVTAATNGEIVIPDSLRTIYETTGGTPFLDGQYTVFGRVTEGLEIVESIQGVATDSADRPLEDVRIIRAEAVQK